MLLEKALLLKELMSISVFCKSIAKRAANCILDTKFTFVVVVVVDNVGIF